MTRTFNDWLNGLEGFALRSERAYDDLTSVPKDVVDHWSKIVVPWLKGAFDAGYESGELNKEYLIQDLKKEIKTQRLEIAGLREERRNILNKDLPPGYTKDL